MQRSLEAIGSSTLKGAIEALLLVSTDAVPATELSTLLGVAPSEVAEVLADLSAEYADANRGFQLREVAGGWRLFTHPAYHDQVERYVRSWDTRRLSQAALETLAVIAYHQPVSRDGVKAVRGVNSEGVIASLKEKGLVREVRGKDRGGAILYGTTRAFLEKFGLRSLKDLPPLEDFAPDEESRAFIRERLSGRALSTAIEDAAADIDEDRELIGRPSPDAGDYVLGDGQSSSPTLASLSSDDDGRSEEAGLHDGAVASATGAGAVSVEAQAESRGPGDDDDVSRG